MCILFYRAALKIYFTICVVNTNHQCAVKCNNDILREVVEISQNCLHAVQACGLTFERKTKIKEENKITAQVRIQFDLRSIRNINMTPTNRSLNMFVSHG